MNSALDHKCPNCDAVLKFNPHGGNWKCEYCRGEFNLEQLEKYESKIKKEDKKVIARTNEEGMDVYICNNCGASIVVDPNISTTSCVYCKNTAILKDKLHGDFNPNYVIPFKHTREDAIAAFKKLGKGKILMPKEFNIKKNINEINGIYIPFWLFDFEAAGEMDADCKKITSWRSGNYRYTKTDTYLVTRGGGMNFANIPVDGSKRFPNDIMNSIEPFDYKDLKEFNYAYLSGFLSEKYDMTGEEVIEEASKRAKNTFILEMKKDIRGYSTVIPTTNSINLNSIKKQYVLLPVWMLTVKYKDKIHTIAMNGQTGKMVGNIPIDYKKAVIIWILIFIITFALVYLFYYFKVMV